MKKKNDLMRQLFGACEGHVCKECSNFTTGRYMGMILRKCQVYGQASDWAGRWPACGMFNKEYTGRPIIEMRCGGGRKPPEQLENQITLFQEEN